MNKYFELAINDELVERIDYWVDYTCGERAMILESLSDNLRSEMIEDITYSLMHNDYFKNMINDCLDDMIFNHNVYMSKLYGEERC